MTATNHPILPIAFVKDDELGTEAFIMLFSMILVASVRFVASVGIDASRNEEESKVYKMDINSPERRHGCSSIQL